MHRTKRKDVPKKKMPPSLVRKLSDGEVPRPLKRFFI